MHQNASVVFAESDLLLPSHREVFEYHDRCTICVVNARVVAQYAGTGLALSVNVPAMNIALLLLGPGSSITNEAMQLLAAANVVVGFSGGRGSPLAAAGDAVFLTTQSEYRPTEFMQAWARMWFNEAHRIKTGQRLLQLRDETILRLWPVIKEVAEAGYDPKQALPLGKTAGAVSSQELLGREGYRINHMYAYCAKKRGLPFKRDATSKDGFNEALTTGNYIAYGLAAVALNALGISFAFPLLHGKTRRGALVFDIADILKDAVVLPTVFATGLPADEYRKYLKRLLFEQKAVKLLINSIKLLLEVPVPK